MKHLAALAKLADCERPEYGAEISRVGGGADYPAGLDGDLKFFSPDGGGGQREIEGEGAVTRNFSFADFFASG